MVELIENESNKYAKRFYQLLLDEGYTLEGSSRYINAKTRIKIRCDKGHVSDVFVNNFLRGSRCRTCDVKVRGDNRIKTDQQYKKEVFDLVGNEYKVIGEYKGSHKTIKLKHNTCGFIYDIRASSFLNGVRCSKCFGVHKKTQEQFVNEVFDLVGDEYEVKGKYINKCTKIEIIHKKCNNKYTVQPANFLNGGRCPSCSQSKGEKKIESYLNKNNHRFIPQDKFNDCRNKLPLPFDFGVYDNASNLICLIEYQGRQHYEPVDWAGKGEEWAEEQFKKVQHNDNIKRQFCKDNNIFLIEIHYLLTDQEVGDFLSNKLAEHLNCNIIGRISIKFGILPFFA